MADDTSEPTFKIWAVDDVVYGPVDLTTLVDWVGDERVVAGTWVFAVNGEAWSRAGEVPELKMFFENAAPVAATEPKDKTPLVPGIRPGTLRRVKIFASMTDQQLGRFAQLMQVEQAPAFKEIVKRGGPGDSMYAVLEGEVRARILVGGKETTLATFQAGDVFGEISLFDDGARSADVIANVDSSLLKIPAAKFDQLCTEHPDLATPLLLALGKTLTARIRNDNKRLGELITLSRAGQ